MTQLYSNRNKHGQTLYIELRDGFYCVYLGYTEIYCDPNFEVAKTWIVNQCTEG